MEQLSMLTKELFEHLAPSGYEMEDCQDLAPIVSEIRALKKEMDAEILCHHFMTADLIHGVADVVADASALVDAARHSDKKTFVVCAIKPLAEAVKLVRPDATVLLPNIEAGCSIADGITAKDVKQLKKEHDDAVAVAYINSTAEVKAESDYIVTSKNARELLRILPDKKVIFYPDKSIAVNMQEEFPDKDIVAWNGKCIVHEEYTVDRIKHFKQTHPNTHILFHSECDPEVIPYGHMHGGTTAMMQYVEDHPEVDSFFMVTECGLADTLRVQYPDKEFVGTCALCPYMKSINLVNTLEIMKGSSKHGCVVELDDDVSRNAVKAMDNMYSLVTN